MRQISRRHMRRAFTLLEVLMVIVILGVLAALVASQFGGTRDKALHDACQAQIDGVLAPKLELFKMHCGRYPTAQEGLQVLLTQPDDQEITEGKKWAGPYVEAKQLKDPWGHDFVYTCPGEYNTNTFDLSSPGANGQTGDDDDVRNWVANR
jgi:general secretion pathway protein G